MICNYAHLIKDASSASENKKRKTKALPTTSSKKQINKENPLADR
jgi:hypothetical protein